MNSNQSAIEQIQELFQIPVVSIVSLSDIIDYLQEKGDARVESILKYQEQWGI